MGAIPDLKRCELGHPGHSVFAIPALRTANDPVELALTTSGVITAIDGELVWVLINGEERRYRNHDTPRLAAVLAQYGPAIRMSSPRYLLIRAGNGFVFNLAVDDGGPLSACSPDFSRESEPFLCAAEGDRELSDPSAHLEERRGRDGQA